MQFMTLIFCLYIWSPKIKRILALSLNWEVNFKLFNQEMGQIEACNVNDVSAIVLIYGSKFY